MDRWTDKMDDGISYKDFFEKLDSIHKDITEIKIQTTKTNGRVTHCEGVMAEHALAIKELSECNRNQDKRLYYLIAKVGAVIIVVGFMFYKLTGYTIAI